MKKAPVKEQLFALFEQASREPEEAKKLVGSARKIAAKSRIKIPECWRRRFCRDCNAFFIPGKNCRIRTRKGLVVFTCLDCGNIRRFKR